MGRLNRHSCYCVGPMDSNREGGKIWRKDITPFLEDMGVVVLNPYEKPLQDTDGSEDDENHLAVVKALAEKRYDDVTKLMKVVRHIDLRMVDRADFIIVNMDWTKRPCGTIREILEADRSRKPIIFHLEQPKNEQPPWMFAETDHNLWFESWSELKDYIHHINTTEVVDKLGRWVFFK
jgi:hypothetical protein